MPVTGVTSTGVETPTDLFSSGIDNSMGKDDFLHLLITELRYQDPLEPMDNQDFIAQMAQFSSLEQMTNVNTNLQLLMEAQQAATTASAISMLGKQVNAAIPVEVETETGELEEDWELISGSVDSIGFEDGVPILSVAGQEVTIDQIVSITEEL
ncbi:MAG: flagellar hook capping FlgD N-terminal domain-containing protein [bacterium]|nr:flagellar hook capping FlgD N-terminal domain-containing protein [bacterium]